MNEPDTLDEDKERELNDDIARWIVWLENKAKTAVMLSEQAMIEQIQAHFIDVLDRGDYDIPVDRLDQMGQP